MSAGPVRVTVLTGFLGAGKTTLLNRLLADPAVTDTAVIVNEFGAVAIDHLLVEEAIGGVVELSGGCLCCTVRGDLVDTFLDLARRMAEGRIRPLRRVVVETTGLADPTPILAMLMAEPDLCRDFALDGVVTAVDALGGEAVLAAHSEAERQVACADRIVLTKTDLAPDGLSGLHAALARLNPGAPVLEAAKGEAGPERLFGCGLYDPATKTADVRRWLDGETAGTASHRGHHHHHDGGSDGHAGHGPRPRIRSFSLEHEAPIAAESVADFLALLRSGRAGQLLRMKAVIRTAGDEARPLVLHGVRDHLHPPVRLPAWPAGMAPASRLVLIGEDLDERVVRDLFAAFAGAPRIDAPDRAALLANPLAIPGHPA